MSQKVENLLNLALDATEEERAKSLELDVGYNPIDREWDLIIKYSGSLEEVRAIASSVSEMANEYAVISIAESRIEELARLPVVDFIEKPKRLFFQVENGKRVSCINEVQRSPFVFVRNSGNVADELIEREQNGENVVTGRSLEIRFEMRGREKEEDIRIDNLYGNGVLIGVVDSGIDFSLPDFRYPDGTTQIRALWDQSIPGNPPAGYAIGTEYTQEQINAALEAGSREEREQIVPSRDNSGHGTAVAGIAAGSGSLRGSLNEYVVDGVQEAVEEQMEINAEIQTGEPKIGIRQNMGVAPGSELIVVKTGVPQEEGFPRTTELMQGVDYIVKKALEYRMPVAINLSFGNTYGSHEPYN